MTSKAVSILADIAYIAYYSKREITKNVDGIIILMFKNLHSVLHLKILASFVSKYNKLGFPGGTSGKESACQCRRRKRRGFDLWVRRRKWHPTPVFLPEESHGQRSLVGCSPWGRKESDTTERLSRADTIN